MLAQNRATATVRRPLTSRSFHNTRSVFPDSYAAPEKWLCSMATYDYSDTVSG
jgi:hypothetical protein